MIYAYSFSPKSELIGFINFFVINLVACFLDMVLAFLALFSQGQSQSTAVIRVSRLTTVSSGIRLIVAILFPTVNFKRALFNMRLKSSQECISALNTLMLTSYSYTEPSMSLREPGIGLQLVIFCAQMVFWWFILILIEKGGSIKLRCRQCCGCNNDLEQVDGANQWENEDGAVAAIPRSWDDAVS